MTQNLVGQIFNNLTVVELSNSKLSGRTLWSCKCSCGMMTTATTHELTSGHKKSCGCLKHRSHATNLIGQRFGFLVVKKRVGTNHNRKALWRCKCDCGKYTTVISIDLISGNTKSCGCLGKNYAIKSKLLGGISK